MENKPIYTKYVSSKKLGWIKAKPEEGVEQAFERKDKKARIYRINSEFTGVVPSVGPENTLVYANLGPFKSLKLARRAIDAYLHDHGFVIYREDVIEARKLK